MTGLRVHLPRELAADFRAEPVQEVTPTEPTVAGVLAALNGRLPGIVRRILDVDGSIRPHINIFAGGREVRSGEGTATPVADGQEVWVIRAVSGGAGGGVRTAQGAAAADEGGSTWPAAQPPAARRGGGAASRRERRPRHRRCARP